MMADGSNYKLTLEELKLREQIKDAVKDATQSLDSFADAQKTIVKNYKLMQALSLEISQNQAKIEALEQRRLNVTQDIQEQIDAEIEALKAVNTQNRQNLALYQGINKELAKKRNFLKAIGGDILEAAKAVKDYFVPGLSEAFRKFLELDAIAHKTANTIGFQGDKFKLMEGNISAVQESYYNMGFDLDDAYKTQSALSEATGRQAMLSVNAAKALTETAKITGMLADELGTVVGEMEAFGYGAETASNFILNLSSESAQMGLNSAKVLKSFQTNLGLLNKLNFKAGVKGLAEMAKFSEKFKISMQSVAAVAEKVFRPEGAIEAAAQLQVLGGSLAALGDPFQLMYKARNAPEELAKSLTKAAVASATINEKGEIQVNANELDRLREAASALNMDYSELVETAKQGAKISKLEGLLGGKGLDSKTMDALVGAANLTEKGGFITIKGQEIELTKLTKTQIDLFKQETLKREELAKKAKSIEDDFNAIKNEIMIALVEVFKGIDWKSIIGTLRSIGTFIKDAILWMKDTFGSTGTLIGGLMLYFGAKAAWYYYLAVKLGTVAGGIISTQMEAAGATIAAQITAAMRSGGVVGGAMNAGSQGLAQMKGSAAMTTASGQAAKNTGIGNFMNSLGSAVKILAVAGAMYILAEALIKFNEVNWTSLIKAGVAMIGFGIGLQFLEPILAEFAALSVSGLGWAGVGLILAFGAAMLMIGGAVYLASSGLAILVDSFTKMFSVIGENGAGLFLAGLGFLALSSGIGILTISLIAMGAASLLALPGLLILGGVTSMLVSTAESLNAIGGSKGLTETINAINSVNEDKLEALKSLANWMALLGGTTTIKFDETLEVGGQIVLRGEGTLSGIKEKLLSDSDFMSNLKDKIISRSYADRNGGKAGSYNKFA